MLKSAVKVSSEEEELDDGKVFVIKKESSPSTAYEGTYPSRDVLFIILADFILWVVLCTKF